MNTIGVITLLEQEEDTLVLEHNGEADGAGHYNCLVRKGGPAPVLPRCIKNALREWSG